MPVTLLLEAMRCGTAVLLEDGPDVPDFFRQEKPAFVLPATTCQDVFARAASCLQEQETLARRAQAGCAVVQERFGQDKVTGSAARPC